MWRSAEHAKTAAEALRITAQDMEKLGVIDAIIEEPLGGAHRDVTLMLERLSDAISEQLDGLSQLQPDSLKLDRQEKYISLGDKGLS